MIEPAFAGRPRILRIDANSPIEVAHGLRKAAACTVLRGPLPQRVRVVGFDAKRRIKVRHRGIRLLRRLQRHAALHQHVIGLRPAAKHFRQVDDGEVEPSGLAKQHAALGLRVELFVTR